MQMIIKFEDKEAYDTCYTFINGNGFCFRTRGEDKMIEFFYEYTLRNVASMCKNTLGLEGRFNIVQ